MEQNQIILLALVACLCLICVCGSISVGYAMTSAGGSGGPGASQWIPTDSMYVPGKAIGSCIEGTTLEACRERCQNNDQCQSFDFGKDGTIREGKCCLNSDTAPLTQSSNYINYRK